MRLRLLKMIVQPVFVLDDGENLTERPAETMVLAPADVATFSERWAEQFDRLRAEVEASPVEMLDAAPPADD